MTSALVLQLLGGAGFLAGVEALLHFLNTRKSTKSKGSAEAYTAYRTFVTGAFDDAARINTGLMQERDTLNTVRALLIDLVQELLHALRKRGATPAEVDPYQDRLDEVRSL